MGQEIRGSTLLDRKVPFLQDTCPFAFKVIKDQKPCVATKKDADRYNS